MQVGKDIGYKVASSNNTSLVESQEFLKVGTVLEVTPTITDDGQVLLQISPSVSTGRINLATQNPEKDTNELETHVLLADGEALVIGGLIKENDEDNQSKIPWLGDLWLVGWLFQHREVTRRAKRNHRGDCAAHPARRAVLPESRSGGNTACHHTPAVRPVIARGSVERGTRAALLHGSPRRPLVRIGSQHARTDVRIRVPRNGTGQPHTGSGVSFDARFAVLMNVASREGGTWR